MPNNPPATLVSTFEILFTPQLPPGLGPSQVAKADELVVKGYFLTIANVNTTAYTFIIGFHCNVNPNPVPSQRTLTSAVGFLDDGTTGTVLTITPGATPTDFSVTVTVAAAGTVLVGILPLFFNSGGLVTPNIECRGWVDITLPALFELVSNGRIKFGSFVPQATAPISVLLTSEERLTFLPAAGAASTAVESQSAFALPPATGAGLVQVPPQPGGPLNGLATNAVAQAIPNDALPAFGQLAHASPAQLAVLLGTLVAASPAVQAGTLSVEDGLRALGITG